MAYQPAYSGQTFDAAKRRGEILQEMQDGVLSSLRDSGAVPMTSGVTRAIPAPSNSVNLFDNIRTEVIRASLSEGPRFLDRHSTDAASTYRNTRFKHFADVEGVRNYAYDDKTGKRVTGPAEGNVTVGIGFNMDRPGAKESWDAVFGGQVSFDDVKAGRAQLTTTQVQSLFDNDIQQFENVVTKASGSRALSENQRLALLSVAYSSPKRVSDWASIIQSGDDDTLRNEILYNSFDKDSPVAKGLRARRFSEAALFSSQTEQNSALPGYSTYRRFESGEQWSKDQFQSTNYSWSDFRNDRFSDAKISSGLVGLLDNVTNQFGSKLQLTSGYRSPEHNDKASFTGKDGPHTHGYAADIDVSGYTDQQKTQLVSLLVANGAQGVGHYDNGSIHVDLRPTRGKGPGGLALWWNHNQPYQNGKSWFNTGVNEGLSARTQG